MPLVYLLTGSNEGNRTERLEAAAGLLAKHAGKVVARSRVYETAAWGNEDLPPHLNQALGIETTLSPEDLLALIHRIETQEGRVRQQRWGVRTLDIDIIYYGRMTLDTPRLSIPHPLMAHRRFVLLPLAEIAPDFIHPLLGVSNQELLDSCEDNLPVTPLRTA